MLCSLHSQTAPRFRASLGKRFGYFYGLVFFFFSSEFFFLLAIVHQPANEVVLMIPTEVR